MKKTGILLALILAGILLTAAAMAEPGDMGQGMAEISVPQFSIGPVSLNVMLTDRTTETGPDIRYYLFDPETGLYACGAGEPAADRAEVTGHPEQGNIFTVSLKEAGKYMISGIPFYVLPADSEPLTALAEEIRAAVDGAEGKNQEATARKLYEWLLKRVKSTLPEDRPELAEACTDPFNCLLTGYAAPEAYGGLYRLLLRSAKVRSIPVTGAAGETEHSWVMCRLDDRWVYADPAMDDVNDKAGKKYFAPEEKNFLKDHALSETSARFLEKRISASLLDLCLFDDRETLDRPKISSEKEGRFLWQFLVDGKRYSLGPSEPVTIRCYSNYGDMPGGIPDWTPEKNVAGSIVPFYFPWDNEHQRFYRSDGTSERVPEGAIEVLDYEPDYSRVTIRFLIPGSYKLNGSDEAFYILDPNNEDHVKAAGLLDEALASCRRDTETETARALHDWEMSQLTYNRHAMDMADYDLYDETLVTAQDPISALITGKSVCGGYSNLYQLLLESAGIRCFYIYGSTSERAYLTHAWNMHKLDGEWSFTDVTWDDPGKHAWFAQPYEKFMKKHTLVYAGKDFMEAWGLPKVYDRLLFRFYRDWGPKDTVPEMFKVLPAKAGEYGFPGSAPNFYNIPFSFEDKSLKLLYPGRTVTDNQIVIMDERGKNNGYIGFFGVARQQDFPLWQDLNFSSRIARITVQDYREGAMPADKPSIRQVIEIPVGGEPEYSAYNYQVPLRKNEIKGYGTGSYRTFTYDMNRKKTAASWHLASETETLDVTACFDDSGNTVRYAVSRAPAGGEAITWEAAADGSITLLSYDYEDGKTFSLADVTDRYTQERYTGYRKNLWRRYPDFISEDNPPENDVRLYALSRTDDEKYAAYAAIATRDPLLRWNEQGGLEFNPDALDLNGAPINYAGFEPDLSVCERLQIAGN